jgi:hypothetical protein
MEYYTDRDRESTFRGTGLFVNYEKLNDPTNVASDFNNFFITLNAKLNIQHIQKGDASQF